MKPVLTVEQVKAAERAAMQHGLGEDMLIESAAACVAQHIASQLPCESFVLGKRRKTRVVVAAGGGNNGADGLSTARMLHLAGYEVVVLCVAKNYGSFALNRQKAAIYAGVPLVEYDGSIPPCDLFVDAMLGTGLSKPLGGAQQQIAETVQSLGYPTLAVDIPSGVCADTGRADGGAVCADQTITFSAAKLGHFLNGARAVRGSLTVCDIGIRPLDSPSVFLLERSDFVRQDRKTVSHKYNYGVVKILAGSDTMPGAAELARRAAGATLRGGAGLVTLCCPNSLKDVFRTKPSESMYEFLPDDDGVLRYDEGALDSVMQKADVILIGSGLSRAPSIPNILRYLAKRFQGRLVLDADALYALSQDPSCVEGKQCDLILTPHVGEFERLASPSPDKNLIERVKDCAKRLKAVVVYKSDIHIITDGKTAYINDNLTPALAKGGTGDVLGGMVAAMAAQRHADTLTAAVQASMAYGAAAEGALTQGQTQHSMLASDLLAHITES